MDKKNFILGVLCLFIAFSLFIRQENQIRPNLNTPTQVEAEPSAPEPVEVPAARPFPAPVAYIKTAQTVVLENEAIRVAFSRQGGAIHSVELKHYLAEKNGGQPYVFNGEAPVPALVLGWHNQHLLLDTFEITQQTDRFIQFRCVLPDGTVVVRGYQLPGPKAENPYLIRTEISLQQPTLQHDHLWLFLGTMPDTPGDKYLEYLNFCAHNGKDTDFKRVADFEASNGFLGMGKHAAQPTITSHNPYVWCALKNQFFAAIFTPERPMICGYFTTPERKGDHATMHGFVRLDLDPSNATLGGTYYVGPKDYIFLDKMGQNQDQLMQFGFFGAVSKVLLLSMRGIHSFLPNWGWTIILLTFIIKLLMWPITQAQLRSSKKMASIQAPLKAIREKYKTNPQKLQMETMKLFKENRVNPAAGCLPVFIQIPIFIGLYYMLRTSSEIRFQSFLWIQDLSIPDTVATVGSFPINILPLLMGITMLVQMKITPMPAVDGMQQKMILIMPFVFLIFCYNFPAALVLYWTVQNLFTILQQWLTQRRTKSLQPATPNA